MDSYILERYGVAEVSSIIFIFRFLHTTGLFYLQEQKLLSSRNWAFTPKKIAAAEIMTTVQVP